MIDLGSSGMICLGVRSVLSARRGAIHCLIINYNGLGHICLDLF